VHRDSEEEEDDLEGEAIEEPESRNRLDSGGDDPNV
jgi:hypothetical protein